MKHDSFRQFLFFILSTCVFLSLGGCAENKIYVDTEKVDGLGAVVDFPSGKLTPIKVKNVLSGNIIELTNNEKVVYIGVHIPDIYDIPTQAKLLNQDLVSRNEIRLEFDKQQRDSKGRLLSYVYSMDGSMINTQIIRAGLAKVLIAPPNTKNSAVLAEAEKEARDKKRGIWSENFSH